MKREEPLVMRLTFHAHLHELVRLIGYEGVQESVLRETVKPLMDAHSKDNMIAAAHELTQTDEKTRLVTLRPNVRKICLGILGPPPEHPDYDFIKYGPVLAFQEDKAQWKAEFAAKKAAEEKPSESAKVAKKKRARKVK